MLYVNFSLNFFYIKDLDVKSYIISK